MDRFESPFLIFALSVLVAIYIPIWIDLKGGELSWVVEEVQDLHSNMDRFESLQN